MMNKKVGLVSFTNLVNEILVVFVQKVKLKSQFWIEILNSKFQFWTLEILGTITYLWIAPMQYKATGIWSCPVWLAPRQVPRAFNNTVRSNRLNDCTLFFSCAHIYVPIVFPALASQIQYLKISFSIYVFSKKGTGFWCMDARFWLVCTVF